MKTNQLEQALEVAGRTRWSAPPAMARAQVRKLPHERPVPALAPDGFTLAQPSDVRSTTAVGQPHTLFSSHSSMHADVSLALSTENELLQLEGRAWCASVTGDPASKTEELEVVWVLDDHVLGTQRVADGEMFRFEGAPVRGWSLEVVLPGHHAIVLQDPRA